MKSRIEAEKPMVSGMNFILNPKRLLITFK